MNEFDERNPANDDYSWDDASGAEREAYLPDDPEPALDVDEEAYDVAAWDGFAAPEPQRSTRWTRRRDLREEARRAASRLIVTSGAYRDDGGRRRYDGGSKRGVCIEHRQPTNAELVKLTSALRRTDLAKAQHHDRGLTRGQEFLAREVIEQDDLCGRGKRRSGLISRSGRRIVKPLEPQTADFLETPGWIVRQFSTGNAPGRRRTTGPLWDRLSLVERLTLIVLLLEAFQQWRDVNGMTFAAGRGRRPKHEKIFLAVWLRSRQRDWGVPTQTLAAVVSRPYRTVADLIAFARQHEQASGTFQPSSQGIDATGRSDDPAPASLRPPRPFPPTPADEEQSLSDTESDANSAHSRAAR